MQNGWIFWYSFLLAFVLVHSLPVCQLMMSKHWMIPFGPTKKHYELVVIFSFFISITARKTFSNQLFSKRLCMANWLEEQNERFLTSCNSKMLSCKMMPLSTNAILLLFLWHDIFQESCSLFTSLYQSWCHNPVATVSLCLLTQNYQHACDLLMVLYPWYTA